LEEIQEILLEGVSIRKILWQEDVGVLWNQAGKHDYGRVW